MIRYSINLSTNQVKKDFLQIIPIGGGKEVGRSCIIIKYKDISMMLDCGIHPGKRGRKSKPFLNEIELEKVDVLLVSHFHLDHSACLPYLTEKTKFHGRIFMTHPTKTIYKLILQDFLRITTMTAIEENILYTKIELNKSIMKIETLDYHEQKKFKGIKFCCYQAGHVLGAAMFFIEIDNIKILYTGDYSLNNDRHLRGAEIPNEKTDILIVESTFGIQNLRPIKDREKNFCEIIHKILKQGGRCLIPCFAIGRIQELMLILDEYWTENRDLHQCPIYYISQIAKRSIQVYTTFQNMMTNRFQENLGIFNPFNFKHIQSVRNQNHFNKDLEPSVVFASPGMLQCGYSRELFERWCNDKRNGIIITGYCIYGTLARSIQDEPDAIESLSKLSIPMKMSVHYIRFGAHADFNQTRIIINKIKPKHIILVHGEKNRVKKLKNKLEKEYKKINIATPENCQIINIEFKKEKKIKIFGKLLKRLTKENNVIHGLMLKNKFNYQLLSPNELSMFTPLTTTEINQELLIPFNNNTKNLRLFLTSIYKIRINDKKNEIKILNMVLIKIYKNQLNLFWKSNPVNDLIVDSIVGLVMTLHTNMAGSLTQVINDEKETKKEKTQWWSFFLQEHFKNCIRYNYKKHYYLINQKNATARVKITIRNHNSANIKISSNCMKLYKKLELLLGCINTAIYPLEMQKIKKNKIKKNKFN